MNRWGLLGKVAPALVVAAATAVVVTAAEKKPFTHQDLIGDRAVGKLVKPTEVKVNNSTFAVGVITDAKVWKDFAQAAGLRAAPDIHFDRHAVVYVILKEHTNRLQLTGWKVSDAGVGTLQFDWDRIEPFYQGAYPAVLHQVDRKGLKKVVVRYAGNTLAEVGVPGAKAEDK